MNTDEIIKDCEDYLFPKLGLSVRERSMYYQLLRHTHLEGRDTTLFAILPLANAIGYSESSAREDVRRLNEKGCIEIVDRSRKGHLVRVLLPNALEGIVPAAEEATELNLEELDFYTSRKFINALLAREDNKCFFCLKALQPQGCELDHLVARAIANDNSYRNIVCSCHDCNTTKQDQEADAFVRDLYRKGVLSQQELGDRLDAIEQVGNGDRKPDKRLVQNAL